MVDWRAHWHQSIAIFFFLMSFPRLGGRHDEFHLIGNRRLRLSLRLEVPERRQFHQHCPLALLVVPGGASGPPLRSYGSYRTGLGQGEETQRIMSGDVLGPPSNPPPKQRRFSFPPGPGPVQSALFFGPESHPF